MYTYIMIAQNILSERTQEVTVTGVNLTSPFVLLAAPMFELERIVILFLSTQEIFEYFQCVVDQVSSKCKE